MIQKIMGIVCTWRELQTLDPYIWNVLVPPMFFF
jgi:hypothetical protein